VAYQLPLIGLLVFTGLALRTGWGPASGQWRSAGLACGPLVLAVVGNELTLVQAMPVLALLGYLLPTPTRPKWWLWMAVGGVATAVAALAPGNWLRAAAMAPSTDPLYAYRWLVLGPRTAYSLVLFLLKPLISLSLLAAAAAGLWLGHAHRAHSSPTVALSRRQWGVVLLAFLVLNGIGFLLFRHLIVGPPLTRAQNEIMLVLLLSTAALAWFAAWQLPSTVRQGLLVRRSGTWLTLLLAGLLSAGHLPEAWRELCTSAAPFDAQMQARFAALRAAHRAGRAAVVLPPLRLPYGHVLIPLRQFSTDIEFDIDLSPGCAGNINGVMERYFEVPNVCADAAAPALPWPR
jgi:hypothetical protein